MDSKVMELRLKRWIPLFEEQARSGLNKQEWCQQNKISRATFFKWQRELREYLLEKNGNIVQAQQSKELEAHTVSIKYGDSYSEIKQFTDYGIHYIIVLKFCEELIPNA